MLSLLIVGPNLTPFLRVRNDFLRNKILDHFLRNHRLRVTVSSPIRRSSLVRGLFAQDMSASISDLPASDEPSRKKLRKGTHSCVECESSATHPLSYPPSLIHS